MIGYVLIIVYTFSGYSESIITIPGISGENECQRLSKEIHETMFPHRTPKIVTCKRYYKAP